MKTSCTHKNSLFYWVFPAAAINTLVFLLVSCTPGFAQPNVVASVKADLQARGVDLSGPCGGFAITARVAWTLRSTGAGLLDKPSGNNCQGRAVDIIIYPDGHAFDILTDSGGSNGPSWSPIDPVDASRWRAPTDPGDTGAPSPKPEGPSSPPAPIFVTTPAIDWSVVLAAIADVRAAQERIFAADKVGERVDALGQRLDQRADELKAAIDSPGWFRSVMGNRYVQMALAGVGTYFATHQAMK